MMIVKCTGVRQMGSNLSEEILESISIRQIQHKITYGNVGDGPTKYV
jgi:hypothetical protein